MWDASDSLNIEKNGSNTTIKQKCCIHDTVEHCFSDELMINTLSLSDIVDKYKFTLDTSEEKALKVHSLRKIVKIKELSNQ